MTVYCNSLDVVIEPWKEATEEEPALHSVVDITGDVVVGFDRSTPLPLDDEEWEYYINHYWGVDLQAERPKFVTSIDEWGVVSGSVSYTNNSVILSIRPTVWESSQEIVDV